MLNDHAKLISFFSQCDEIVGRKRLQKMIYILKKCKFPFQERYQFHFYGPYSEELTLRMEELCNLGFVTEQKEKKSNYYQYRYALTDSGKEFLTHYNLDMPSMQEQIEKMNGKSSRFLELVATMLYFDKLTKSEMIDKINVVKGKQNYTNDEIEEAWTFIDEMKAYH